MNNTDQVLLQGYLLINSKQISDFKQQKVYVSLSTNSLNCFDEDPSISSNQSRLISSYNMNGLKVLESSQSNQPKSFGITLIDQSYLEFICPTNSVKFQWMKQIISASTNVKSNVIKSHVIKDSEPTGTNYYKESKVQNNDLMELYHIYNKEKEGIMEPIKTQNNFTSNKILTAVPKNSYDVSILDRFSVLSDSINNIQNQNKIYSHSSGIVIAQPTDRLSRMSPPSKIKDKEIKKKTNPKILAIEHQQQSLQQHPQPLQQQFPQWIPCNYGNKRHSSKKISPVRSQQSIASITMNPDNNRYYYSSNTTTSTTPRSRSAGPKIRESHSLKYDYNSNSSDQQWDYNYPEYNNSNEKQRIRSSSTSKSNYHSQIRNESMMQQNHSFHSYQNLNNDDNANSNNNNELLSKSMDNMTLAELRAAFLTIPANIRDSLLTPSSTLDNMKDSRMNSINFDYQHDLIPSIDEYNNNDTSNNEYNNNNNNGSQQIRKESDEHEDNLHDISIGINENYVRYRPANVKTPVFAKGNFYYDSNNSNEDVNRTIEKNNKVYNIDNTATASYNNSNRSKSPSRIPIPMKVKATSPNNNEPIKNMMTSKPLQPQDITIRDHNQSNGKANNKNYDSSNNNLSKPNTKYNTVETNNDKVKLSNSNNNNSSPPIPHIQLKGNIDSSNSKVIDKKQTLEWSQKQAWEKNIRSDYVGIGTNSATGTITFKILPRYNSPEITNQMMPEIIASQRVFTGMNSATRLPIGMSPPKVRAGSTEKNPKLSYNNNNKMENVATVSIQQQQQHINNNITENNVTGQAERQRMTEWLKRIGMQRYIDNMHAHGITKLSMIELFDEEDMRLVSIDEKDIPVMLHNIRELSKRIRSISEQVLLDEDPIIATTAVISTTTATATTSPNINKENSKMNSHSDGNQLQNKNNDKNNNNIINQEISIAANAKTSPPHASNTTYPIAIKSSTKIVLDNKTTNALNSNHNKLKDILSMNSINYKSANLNANNSSNKHTKLFGIDSKKYIKNEYEHIYTSYNEIISELLRCFDVGAGKLFFHAWKQALLYMPDKKPAIFNARQVIEFHLYLHFAIYSIANELGKRIQNECIDMLKQYLENIKISLDLASNNINYETMDEIQQPQQLNQSFESIPPINITSKQLNIPTIDVLNDGTFSALSSPSKTLNSHQDISFLNSREYATYAGIVLVPDPRQNIAFQPLFRKEWSVALRHRLEQFLDLADSSYYRKASPSVSNNTNINNNSNNNINSYNSNNINSNYIMDDNMADNSKEVLECKNFPTTILNNNVFIPLVKSTNSSLIQNIQKPPSTIVPISNDLTTIVPIHNDITHTITNNYNDNTNNINIVDYHINIVNESQNISKDAVSNDFNVDDINNDDNIISNIDDIVNHNNTDTDNNIFDNIDITTIIDKIDIDDQNTNIDDNNINSESNNNIEINNNIVDANTDIPNNTDLDYNNIDLIFNINNIVNNNESIDNSSQTTSTRRKITKFIQHQPMKKESSININNESSNNNNNITTNNTTTTTNNNNIPITCLDDYNMLTIISPLKFLENDITTTTNTTTNDIIEDAGVVSPTESILSQLTIDSTKPFDDNNNNNNEVIANNLVSSPLKLYKSLENDNYSSRSNTKKPYNLLSKNTMQSQVLKYNKLLKQTNKKT